MGEIEGWGQSSGLVHNGLLPNQAALVNRDLDSERWSKAEERISELIACIQPNQPSEDRRNDVANYVQRLITKCFPCQVFTFGSVPLKTYLPDGDIDLTAFSSNEIMKDTWANHVRDTLLNEEKNENAEFSVKEVQYIQAEVKLIKCLVENIVVDISFNQLSGLCTLCFLEEVDHLINHNHLFKRSVILIKAWCYYESRVLGAHHGLISTYALETLVLYIFHVFNNSFTGPLEVLYRFLEFFSKFDWDNFCVSLWGPVPISSLPDVKAEPPRKDSGELLLSKLFIDACSSVYAVSPGSLDNQGQPFVSKHFNVIDPLRINNNLGRSVSKGNFYRIRSAFSFGAKRLASLLECPKEELYYEVNQFFMNTWDRYGSGNRPDAPENSLSCLSLSTKPSQLRKPENLEKKEKNKVTKENTSGREIETSRVSHFACPPQLARHPLERTSRSNEVSTFSSNKKRHATNSRISNHIGTEVGGNQCAPVDKEQKSSKLDYLTNDVQGMHLLARTRSSPELTDTYSDTSSKGRRSRGPETRNSRIFAAGLDAIRKNMGSHNFPSKVTKSTATKQITSSKKHDDESNNGLKNRYMENSGSVAVGEEDVSAMGTKGMLQEEQDIVNMTSSAIAPDLNGNVHMPMNLASTHTPLSISHLGSMEISNVSCSTRSDTSLEPSDECKSDILHSDFTSHWQNLQYGRFCHNPQYHGPLVYPPPVVVQPMYLQGRAPWDGPGRPLSSNMNSMTQVISYRPQVVLVAADPTPSVSSSSSGVYQRYPDEMPRYRSGTGTYLPNPKVSTRDRHASGSRRGHFSFEKSNHNGERSDRDGNWNSNSKTRTAGRDHSRNQAERSSARIERSAVRDSQADRPWSSYRPESFHSYQSQNGPMRSNSSARGGPAPANVVYGMYPLQTVKTSRDLSNGPTVMAMYPYYHDSSAEQLEFGTHGHGVFSESSEITRDGGRSSETYDEQRFHNSSNRRSSPD